MAVPREHKYLAFISYAHKDKDFAVWLHKHIEQYRIPKSLRKTYPNLPQTLKRSIFRDEEELAGGSDLSATLKTALERSDKLIVICSPASSQSRWVEEEVRYFKEHSTEEKIFTLLKQGSLDKVLPKALAREPLAINMKVERRKGLMKVIASILEVDFADLWRRELKELRKRWALGSGLGMIFVIMILYLYVQSIAISSNTELEKIKKEIVLLEHRLKRLDTPNQKRYEVVQKLKVLEETKKLKEETLKWFGMFESSLIDKAKEAYDKEGAKSALMILESISSQAEDARYAKKNILRAKLYLEMREYEKADESYRRAIHLDAGYETVYDYALFLMQQNHVERAKVLLEKLEEQRLLEVQRANVLNRLGIVYRQLQLFDKAQSAYAEALLLREKLTQEDSKRHKNDLAWTYNNLGILYENRKVFALAEKNHLKALSLRQDLMEREGREYAYFVSCSMHNLGELYKSSNKPEKAENFLKSVLKSRRELFKKNPKKLMHPLASTLHELATLYLSMGRVEASEKLYGEALVLRRELVQYNVEAYQYVLADTLNALITLYQKANKVEEVHKLESELKALALGESSAT